MSTRSKFAVKPEMVKVATSSPTSANQFFPKYCEISDTLAIAASETEKMADRLTQLQDAVNSVRQTLTI